MLIYLLHNCLILYDGFKSDREKRERMCVYIKDGACWIFVMFVLWCVVACCKSIYSSFIQTNKTRDKTNDFSFFSCCCNVLFCYSFLEPKLTKIFFTINPLASDGLALTYVSKVNVLSVMIQHQSMINIQLDGVLFQPTYNKTYTLHFMNTWVENNKNLN